MYTKKNGTGPKGNRYFLDTLETLRLLLDLFGAPTPTFSLNFVVILIFPFSYLRSAK